MKRLLLILLFVVSVLSLLSLTTVASLERNVLDNGHLMKDRWFLATLLDAYLGFITLYLWIAYKLDSNLARLAWGIGVMLLGNLAIGAFVIWQLLRWRPQMGWADLLLAERDLSRLAATSHD
jgi:hypothetical protein